MRRGAPPGLRLDVGPVPAFAGVAGGSRGLALVPAPAPEGESAPGPDLRLQRNPSSGARTPYTSLGQPKLTPENMALLKPGVPFLELTDRAFRYPPALAEQMFTSFLHGIGLENECWTRHIKLCPI